MAGSPAATTTSVGFCLKSSRNTAAREEEEEEKDQRADRLRYKKIEIYGLNSTNSACVHKRELIVVIKVSVEEVEQTERECPESPPHRQCKH